MSNKIPNSRQKSGPVKKGSGMKNVVSRGSSRPNPTGEISGKTRGKLKGPGVTGAGS